MNPQLQQILHDITVRITKLEEAQQPQRTWVGLTDEDKKKLATGHPYASWGELCSTVEAKLKEKNT
jgi:hypothetical protein